MDFDAFLFGKLLRSQIPDSYVSLSNKLREHLTKIVKESPNGEKIVRGEVTIDQLLLQKILDQTSNYVIIDDKELNLKNVSDAIVETQKKEMMKMKIQVQQTKQVYNLDAGTGASALNSALTWIDPNFKTVVNAFMHQHLEQYYQHIREFHSIFTQIDDQRICKLSHF